MDDKDIDDVNSQLLEDFKKFCTFMMSCRGSEVWLERTHGRQKTIAEKINLSSSSFLVKYKADTEKEIKKAKEEIEPLKQEKLSLQRENINLKREIQGLKENLKNEIKEKEIFIEYSTELDTYCNTLNKKLKENLKNDSLLNENSTQNTAVNNSISTNDTKKQHLESPHVSSGGKALELPPRSVREVLRLYCQGSKIKDIAAETGAERRQIKRIVTGDLKHPKSKEKVLKAVNKLLKVNQNKDFINKLEEIKKLYS